MIDDDVEKMLRELVNTAIDADGEPIAERVDQSVVDAAEVLVLAIRSKRSQMSMASVNSRMEATNDLAKVRAIIGAFALSRTVAPNLRVKCARLVLV